MKSKLLTSLLIIFCFYSCTEHQKTRDEQVKQYISIVTIDSCEYIEYDYGVLTHKGNCKYCAERTKKLLKSER